MRSSILVSISIVFALALISLNGSAFLFFKLDQDRFLQSLNFRYSSIVKSIQLQSIKNPHPTFIEYTLENFNMQAVKDVNLTDSSVIYESPIRLGFVEVLQTKQNLYLRVSIVKHSAIFIDKSYKKHSAYDIWIIALGMNIVLVVLFVYIIMRIKPLKKMRKEISKFAKGNLDINLPVRGKDEIAEVAQTFNEAIFSLKNLKESRELLLRNLMHEIKTPIAKGRILTEMLDDEITQKRYISIFQRLNDLVNEFGALEKMEVAFEPNKNKTYFFDSIKSAMDLGMFNKDKITIERRAKIAIHVDEQLFNVALKNLIDNALKYSVDDTMSIIIQKNKALFINQGNPLQRDLEYYLEPFHRDHNKNKKDGLGLGLYIIDRVLKMHRFKLSYAYQNGRNIFAIHFNKG